MSISEASDEQSYIHNSLRVLGPISKILVRDVARGEDGPSRNDVPSADDVAHAFQSQADSINSFGMTYPDGQIGEGSTARAP